MTRLSILYLMVSIASRLDALNKWLENMSYRNYHKR